MKKTFNSALAEHFKNFVKLRRLSGLNYSPQEKMLLLFDQYLASHGHSGPLPTEMAEEFLHDALGKGGEGPKSYYYQVIRHFYDYLTVVFPEQCKLPIDEHQRVNHRPTPRLFSEDELAAILRKAARISRHNEIRNKTLYATLSLAIACGLRRSEVVGLEMGDVDTTTGTLSIRKTKFGKSRIIPIGDDLCRILSDYRDFRLKKYPLVTTPRFFITLHKSAMSSGWLYQSFREVLWKLGMAPATGHAAHLHDLRHTFAVRTISAWYRNDRDVQELLPALATYMGHSHYSDTAYYLTLTAELLGFALDNFDKVWTKEVTYDED